MATPNLTSIGFLTQCARFMCPNKDSFSTYEAVSKGVVLMGNMHPVKLLVLEQSRLKCLMELLGLLVM